MIKALSESKLETPKPEISKPETQKLEILKPETPKSEISKPKPKNKNKIPKTPEVEPKIRVKTDKRK